MSNLSNKLTQAIEAFQRKDYVGAQRLLAQCDPRQAAHLRGLVERRLGNLDSARRYLEQAARDEPNNHEVFHNQALLLLEEDSVEAALTSLGTALALKPGFVAAQRTKGRALRQAKRWAEAKQHYASLLAAGGEGTVFEYGLGIAELELGDAESACDRFGRLLARGMTESAIYFMHGRAALEAGHQGVAQSSLLTAHAAAPTALTLRELARLYWMQGERQAFDELLMPPFPTSDMATTSMELLRLSGAPAQSLAAIVESSEQGQAGDLPGLTLATQHAIVAQSFVDQGEPVPALHHASRCLAMEPHHDTGMAANISALLMSNQSAHALQLTRDMQHRQPNAQQWIAYEATALRVSDASAYAQLVDINHHVRVFDLPVPPGYANISDFNQALLAALDRLQVFKVSPIDQSLRLGTQTARDLVAVNDPVIQAYLSMLDQPVREYMAAMGTDSSHPLSRRNTGDYAISGCWSVRLTGGGFHVNHMHPEGWISSAYYVSVPESNEQTRSGWIKFSEPPFDMTPALEPERWIKPVAGMLVLFPSFLWHGTAPIVDDGVRVTAPFDAIPV